MSQSSFLPKEELNILIFEVSRILTFKGDNMEPVEVAELYKMGLKFQLLSRINTGDKFKDRQNDIDEVVYIVYHFLQQPKLHLSLCLHELKSLHTILNKWVEYEEYGLDEWDVQRANPETVFSKYDVKKIRDAYKQFENVLFAELRKKHIYIIPPVRAFSTDILLDDAAKAFDPTLLPYIPKRSIEDIQAAGKCLATNIPLGMSFYLFRAIEGELRAYGSSLGIINSQLKESDRNWGNYLNVIKGKGAKHGIVQFLKQIKDSYRNPMIHVDAELDAKQAPAFFSLAIGTIELIADLAKTESKNNPNSLLTVN